MFPMLMCSTLFFHSISSITINGGGAPVEIKKEVVQNSVSVTEVDKSGKKKIIVLSPISETNNQEAVNNEKSPIEDSSDFECDALCDIINKALKNAEIRLNQIDEKTDNIKKEEEKINEIELKNDDAVSDSKLDSNNDDEPKAIFEEQENKEESKDDEQKNQEEADVLKIDGKDLQTGKQVKDNDLILNEEFFSF